ncbi:MAG TPA: hypothetical protein VGY55_02715 [Pirellulales bacterium]|jgi:hypothetical protein|nr:hypothetical protein [Pirellulales bacterium]
MKISRRAAQDPSSFTHPLYIVILAHTSATHSLMPKPPIPNAELAAPRTSGAKLILPPIDEAGEWAAANRRIIDRSDYELQGRRLSALAAQARDELLIAALRHTRSYRDVAEPAKLSDTLFLAGHQPEIYHPGVWLKNFILDRLARRHDGVAINLVIDSDTIKSSALRVPGGSIAEPTVEGVLFDRPSAEIPFQSRTILDQELFESFGRRAAARLAPLVPDPMLIDYWPLAVACSQRTRNLGECLAQSRHQWEGSWGLSTLEIPQSCVCQLEAFQWLSAHLLAHLPRFWDVYNSALADYRRCYHVRSQAHPVPELAVDDQWLEAPFWIWTDEDPRRRRVFARQRGDDILLTDRERIEVAIPLSADSDGARAVQQLAALGDRGIHLRSRALLTTLAARLVFGDLFLHGVGGAKYDRLTDAIIERFFGLDAPAYMVVSGTLHLPIARPTVSGGDLRDVERELRDLTFHPERFITESPRDASDNETSPAPWLEMKRRWIAAPFAPSQARERYRAIRAANEDLQRFIVARREEALRRSDRLARELRAEAILSSRDYGFGLYPEKSLHDFLLAFPVERV